MLMEFLNLSLYQSLVTIISFVISKVLFKIEDNKFNLRDIYLYLIMIITNILFSSESYIIGQLIIKVIVFSLVIKKLFNTKILTSIALSIISSIIIIVAETILIVLDNYENLRLITDCLYITLFNGILTSSLSYCISKVFFIKEVINKFLTISEKSIKKNNLVMIWFSLVVIFFFYYLVVLSRYYRINQFTLILIMITSFLMFIIHMCDINRYNRLIEKYNNVLDYACNYEEELEKDILLRHEHKNQLAVIKGLSKNQKVKNYIDEILKNNKKDNSLNINGINKLPKGGIRGLIYYKICCMKKKNIKYSLDISKNIKEGFVKVSDKNKRVLSYVLGVFLDNAIEECKDNISGNISIEIYLLNNNINIVIANTLLDKINIKKIGKRGYSTKGKNRGNGIFLVDNLLKDNKSIKTSNKIINNYFIQEIVIFND